LSADSVRSILHGLIEGRQLDLLGDPRVNVLRLNLALDAVAPAARDSAPAKAALVAPR
jgi:K+-transporting ATPase ATPase C chain